MKITNVITAIILAVGTQCAYCQENDAVIRQGKVTLIDTEASLDSLSIFPFINLEANKIDMKGNDWRELKMAIENTNNQSFNIVHIGDSHLQADIGTGHVRELLQAKYGNGGRGLICPLKICGTNEPYSYIFTTSSKCFCSRLLKKPWVTDMGFTGTAFMPQNVNFNLTLSTVTDKVPYGSPFDKIIVFGSSELEAGLVVNESNMVLTTRTIQHDYYTEIILPIPVVTAKITLFSMEQTTIYGVSLNNGECGVKYHTIGNNGATFATYNELQTVGHDISLFNPKLVIISLGTNEAFSNITDSQLEADIDYMIANILRSNPKAKILLTTPMECQKSKIAYRRRKGRKRRVKSSSFIINEKVKQMRNVILNYAERHSIPVYDFYSVAGGEEASIRWSESDLMARDHIHNSYKGYLLRGDLFYHALINAITNERDN